jgi:hypothetical protein
MGVPGRRVAADDEAVGASRLRRVELRGRDLEQLREPVSEALDVARGGEAQLRLEREGEQARVPSRPAAACMRATSRTTPVAASIRCSAAKRSWLSTRASASSPPSTAGSTTNASALAVSTRSTQPRRRRVSISSKKAGPLEHAQVVVDPLAAQAELGGQRRGGGRLAQPLEQRAANRG